MARKTDDTPDEKPAKKDGPSLYEEAGREGGRVAQRMVLRVALEATDWNISHAAKLLNMSRPGLSAAVRELLPTEFAAAQASGRIVKGRPSNSDE